MEDAKKPTIQQINKILEMRNNALEEENKKLKLMLEKIFNETKKIL